eukprot:757326-Hanusia_phi.AAC.5
MANLPPPALKRNNSGGFEQRIARGPDVCFPDSKGFRGAGRGSGPIPKSGGAASLGGTATSGVTPAATSLVAATPETPVVVGSDNSRESLIAAARAKAAEDAIRKQKQLDAAAKVQNSQAIIPTLPLANSSSQRKLIEAAMEEASRKKKQLDMAARSQGAPSIDADQENSKRDRMSDPQFKQGESGERGQFDNVKSDPQSLHKQLLMQAAEDAKRKQRQLEAAAKAQSYSAPVAHSAANVGSSQNSTTDAAVTNSSEYDLYAEKQAKEKSAAQRKREEAMEEAQRKQRQLEAAALAQSILPSSKNLVLHNPYEAEEMSRRHRHLEDATELAARKQRQLAAAAYAQDSPLPGLSLSREASLTKNDISIKPPAIPEKNAWASNKPLASPNVNQPQPNAWGVNMSPAILAKDTTNPKDQTGLNLCFYSCSIPNCGEGVSWSKVAAGRTANGPILNGAILRTDRPGVVDTSEDTDEVFCYGSSAVDGFQGGSGQEDGVPHSWEDSIPQPEPVRESAWKKPLRILGVETGRPNDESDLDANGEDFNQQASLDFATGFGQVRGCDDLMPFELTCDMDGTTDKEGGAARQDNPSGSSALSEDIEGDSQSPSIALKMLLGIGKGAMDMPIQIVDRKLPVWGRPGGSVDITLDPAVAQISKETPDGIPANSSWPGDSSTPVPQLQNFQGIGNPAGNEFPIPSSSGFLGNRQDMSLGVGEMHTTFSGPRQDLYSMPTSKEPSSSNALNWLGNQNQNVDWFSNMASQRPSFSFQDSYSENLDSRTSAAHTAPGNFGSYPSNAAMNGFDFNQGSMLGKSSSAFNADPFSSSQRMGYGGLGQVENTTFHPFASSDAQASRANGGSFLSAPSSFIVPSSHQPTSMQGSSNPRGPWDQQPTGYGYASGFASDAGTFGGGQVGYDRGYMTSSMHPGENSSRQFSGEGMDPHRSSENVLRLFGMAGSSDLRDEEPNLSGLTIGDDHLLKPEAFTRFQEPSGHGGPWGQGGTHGDNNFNFSKFFGGLAGNGEVQPMPSIPPSTGMMSLAEIEGKQFRT